MVQKEKMIYSVMYRFRGGRQSTFRMVKCWIPRCYVDGKEKECQHGDKEICVGCKNVKTELNKILGPTTWNMTAWNMDEEAGNKDADGNDFEGRMPPTFFETNNVTGPSMELINMYGVPAYKEVNPALFTIMTFPIQFGIMFGDMGHGAIHLCFAIGLFFAPPAIRKFRYLYLLMALFACFSGSLYNEVFAIPIDIFGSCYENRNVIFKFIIK